VTSGGAAAAEFIAVDLAGEAIASKVFAFAIVAGTTPDADRRFPLGKVARSSLNTAQRCGRRDLPIGMLPSRSPTARFTPKT
jgi:hypothetical protein